MYRSFVRCDDPKGVAECGTFRKSRSVSQKMEDKIKSQRTQRNSDTSLLNKGKKEETVAKGNVEDYHGPSSSAQLLEVSRGAHKLNHLIDSWSKGLACDGQSRDIAKDLLKGALDLQESLNMLGKLQEASQYVARLKKKQKQLERGRIIDVGNERINSDRLGHQRQHLGFQKPRLSNDGSSRDCIEELRNAIVDGLAKQDLLANTSSHEKMKFDKRKMESVSQKPSTSSSYSSVVWSDNSHSTSSSSSQTALQKDRSPNLIARLMGLEEIPSKTMMQSPIEQFNVVKNLSRQRPVFDTEMPKPRKPPSIVQKVDSERRTPREILETVQFQGLLKGSSAEKFKSKSHHSSDFHHKQRLIDDSRPIVLIKPMRVSRPESEEEPAPMVWQERSLSKKMMQKKKKTKEGLAHSSVDEKRVSSEFSNTNRRSKAEETPMERIIQEEGTENCMEEVAIPVEKEVRMINQKEGTVSVNKVHRKLKAEPTPGKRFRHEGAKDHKKAVVGKEGKEIEKKPKDYSKMIVSSPAGNQLHKKEAADKKEDKVQKMVSISRKPVEMETAKSKTVSRSPDQAKLTSITTNDNIIRGKCISKHATQNKIHNNRDGKQKEKQASEHGSAEPTIDIVVDVSCNNHSQKTKPKHLVKEEGIDASEFQTSEHSDDSRSSTCVITMPTPECGMHFRSSEEADEQMTHANTYSTSSKTGNQLKNSLLSNVSFLNRAEEAFHLMMNHPTTVPTSGVQNSGVLDMKLSLDYANEFIERRSLPDSQTRHLPLTFTGNSRVFISLDRLVDEVCSGVETLRRYHKLASKELRGDGLYATLESDIMCKEVVSGTWDLGWRKFCSAEEVEQTVNELEKLLVSELIDELFP